MKLILFAIAVLTKLPALQAQYKNNKHSGDDDHPFTKVETEGGYKKGRNAFIRYLQTHIKYPKRQGSKISAEQ